MTTSATATSETASQANGSTGATVGADATAGTSAGAGASAKAKRKRGPNKPKPGAIEVHTDATMHQAEILKLLIAHAASDVRIGADAAAKMELQVNTGDGWRHIDTPARAIVRFATKNHE